METNEFNKKQVIIYLLFAFALGWAIQVGVYFLTKGGSTILPTIIMALMMFVPLLGVLIARRSLSGMGWKPKAKKFILPALIAWFAPIIVTAIGAVIYFLIFPSQFDVSGANADPLIIDALNQAGIPYAIYLVISVISTITYAPVINTVVGLGEEVGWRGFLYPQLKYKFGKKLGWIIGGCIWGAWHWPLIWLTGYEYGTEYFGYPVVGMLVFLLFTVSLGIICDFMYEKSECIWIPALLHGSINAATTVPVLFAAAGVSSNMILGPLPNGLIAGIPLFAIAVVLFIKSQQGSKE